MPLIKIGYHKKSYEIPNVVLECVGQTMAAKRRKRTTRQTNVDKTIHRKDWATRTIAPVKKKQASRNENTILYLFIGRRDEIRMVTRFTKMYFYQSSKYILSLKFSISYKTRSLIELNI